jgi:hypothetical protein
MPKKYKKNIMHVRAPLKVINKITNYIKYLLKGDIKIKKGYFYKAGG